VGRRALVAGWKPAVPGGQQHLTNKERQE
jgi:hypothetical protein